MWWFRNDVLDTASLLRYLTGLGIKTSFIDVMKADNYRQAAGKNTRLLWIENAFEPISPDQRY